MKKQLLCSVVLTFLFALSAQAQDIILKVSGDEVKAKVVEITLSQVLYKLPDLTKDSLYALDRKEVFMVTFANGTKEVMQQESMDSTSVALTPTQMALLGKKDAKMYYKGNGALWGSALTTYLFFPAVLVIGAIPPKAKPSEVSNINYLSDKSYMAAYKKQAHKRKVGKVAIGTGIGAVTLTAVTTIMLLSAWGQ